MLNKNHHELITFSRLGDIVDDSLLNSILFENALTKIRFLSRLVNELNFPVIYLDFDLLFSGYVVSKTIKSPADNITIVRPTLDNFQNVINEVIHSVVDKKTIVIIDSLNVLSNFFSGKDSGRMLNAYLMLLASISEQSDSRIIFSSVAKKKDGMWVLSPTNRHIIDSGKILKIFVTENYTDIDLEVTRENIVRKFSVRKDS